MILGFWWAVVFLAIFLIGVTKSGFGAGVGLIMVPMMTVAMDHIPGRGSEAAFGFMAPLLVVGDLIAIYQYRHLFSMTIVKRLLPGTFIGVILAGTLLWWLNQHKDLDVVAGFIKLEIGFESVGLVSLVWWQQYHGIQHRLWPEPTRSHMIGGFSAISSTLAHAAGPIIAMYLLPLNLDRQLFVGTCAIYFFILNTAKIGTYALAGQFQHASPAFALCFLPLVLVGAFCGLWMNRKLNDKSFSKFIYISTFALGWYVLYDGAKDLARHWFT